MNAQVGLRAGSLVFRQYKVADAKLDATLDGGMLRITTLQGKAWGGALDATAFADARASRIGVKANASGVNSSVYRMNMNDAGVKINVPCWQ